MEGRGVRGRKVVDEGGKEGEDGMGRGGVVLA